MFGMRKKATAQPLLGADDFLTPDMRLDYYRWMRSQRRAWISRGRKPPSRLTDLGSLLGLASASSPIASVKPLPSSGSDDEPTHVLARAFRQISDPGKRRALHLFAFPLGGGPREGAVPRPQADRDALRAPLMVPLRTKAAHRLAWGARRRRLGSTSEGLLHRAQQDRNDLAPPSAHRPRLLEPPLGRSAVTSSGRARDP